MIRMPVIFVLPLRRRIRGVLAGLLICLVSAGAAQAACGTSATVSATALAFGTINPLVLPQDSTATLTIQYHNTAATCNSSTVVTMGVGAGTGATAATRKLTSGANLLNYTLYTPPGPPTAGVWDNVTGYTTPTISIPNGATTNQTVTIYGRVLSGQSNAAIGSYSDTVVITVTF
jgi:spore coat protein U-like protein